MGDNKTYWHAMELHARFLRGEISEAQLQAEPAWQWFEKLQKNWSERDKDDEQIEHPEQIAKTRRESRSNGIQRIDVVLKHFGK